MSGISPKAEVDDRALLGFDPSAAARSVRVEVDVFGRIVGRDDGFGRGIARTSNDQSRDQGPCRGKSRCFEIE